MKKPTTLKISILVGLLSCSSLFNLSPTKAYAANFATTNKQITYTSTVPAITVTGYAERIVAPDTASITLGVINQASTSSDAKTSNDEIMALIITNLSQLGLAKADMKTSSFSITPTYTLSPDKATRSITGYSVRNMLTVKTHDFTELSNILQKATDAGANEISSVRFYLEDATAIKTELTVEALQNGKKEALLIANSLGLHLGDVLSASVSNYSPTYNTVNFEKLSLRTSSANTPLEAGTLKIDVTANLAFAINQ